MVIIHSPKNTCFERHDIQNCKNVNWVSGTWTGVTWSDVSLTIHVHMLLKLPTIKQV